MGVWWACGGGCFGGFSVLPAAVSDLSEKFVIFAHPPLWGTTGSPLCNTIKGQLGK